MRARFHDKLRDDTPSRTNSEKEKLHLSSLSSPMKGAPQSPRPPIAMPSPPTHRRAMQTRESGPGSPRSAGNRGFGQSPKVAQRRLLSQEKLHMPVISATSEQTDQQESFKKLIRQFFNNNRQAFDTFDRKKHGVITRHDFMHALDVVGMKICEADRHILRRMIDKRNTKTISFLEFDAFMNSEIVAPSNQAISDPMDTKEDVEIENAENLPRSENGVAQVEKMVAGCSIKQPIEAPPTQEELDAQADELVSNFLLDLYTTFEQEEEERKQMPDNSQDKASAQDWTVVRHKKKVKENGEVWYDSESSEDSDCDDADLDLADLPEGSFKRIPIARKKTPASDNAAPSSFMPKCNNNSSPTMAKPKHDFGSSIFGFESFGMFGGI